MLIPRYYFSNDYSELYTYFLTMPHKERTCKKGTCLWAPGEFIQRVYYIKSGICVTAAEHEEGYRKILYFHSSRSVCPGFHKSLFKIEKSLITTAITDMELLEFTKDDMYRMFQENRQLSAIAFESYARLINLLIYETAHQEYNNSFIKLCNLLYLFSQNSPSGNPRRIDLSQENIADILTLNRVNVAKCLSRLRDEGIIVSHRKWIELTDPEALEHYCSHETLSTPS
mgnify:CR=1 FL=1